MTLNEVRNLQPGTKLNLIRNATGKGLGVRTFVKYLRAANELLFDIDGSESFAGLSGVGFASTENGFRLTFAGKLIAEYEKQ